MDRIRFILVGAVIGIAWAASLRGFMMVLAGPDSTFTFGGTFGVIIPTGIVVGALLGWAEHQRRTGHQHRLLILAPLLLGVVPLILHRTASTRPHSPSRCSRWSAGTRCPAAARSGRGSWPAPSPSPTIPVTFLAPKPYPDLSATTPHGAWFATLACSLFVTLALACSIPMRRPETRRLAAGRPPPTSLGRAAATPRREPRRP